jgi:Cd2+/Zn2+-exporting ATPase
MSYKHAVKENKTTPTVANPAAPHDDQLCLEIINQAVAAEPGIVGVEVDTGQRQVAIAYDPALIEPPALAEIAEQIRRPLQHNLETCTMRLGARGGRACESCALALERRVRQIPGVRQASASYRGGVLSVTYDRQALTPEQMMQRIRRFGVKVSPSAAELPLALPTFEPGPTLPPLRRAWEWLRRQNLAAIFTALTLAAMLLAWLAEHLALSPLLSTTLYIVAYLAGGIFGLKGGLEAVRERTIDVDLLMILAALGAAVVGAPFEGALLLFLFSLSNVLQDYALERTRNAIKALMKLRPDQALIRRGGELMPTPIERVAIGDRFVVRPGDRIPLDGVVIEGESAVDQAAITGESMPVAKQPGALLLAGTINKNGSLEAKVTKLAKDSTLARLIKLVEEAQSEKAPTQRFLDKAEQYYAMGVILFTILVALTPIVFMGEAFQTAFYRAMTVMVAASPCALIISTPASILAAIGNGARKGILFKGGVYMEQAAGIKVVAFDKTGTLTEGKARLTDVIVLANSTEEGVWRGGEAELLALAAAVESRSEHALGRATVEAAQARDLALSEAMAFQAATGQGVQASVDGLDIWVGNLRYFEAFNRPNLAAAQQQVERLQAEGKTSVVVAQITDAGQTAHMLGVIAFADRLRADSARVVRELKEMGVERVVMLTGDHERVARSIADQLQLDGYYAGLLPEDKVRIIQELQAQYGAVAMVGDGVNDAPALARAAIGIAMGAAGTDVALETADVVLMSDDLQNIAYVIALSRQTRQTLAINLAFALVMILIMLAAIFSANMPLPLAVVGHEGGTVLVSLNGLRLLIYKRRRVVKT